MLLISVPGIFMAFLPFFSLSHFFNAFIDPFLQSPPTIFSLLLFLMLLISIPGIFMAFLPLFLNILEELGGLYYPLSELPKHLYRLHFPCFLMLFIVFSILVIIWH